MLIWTMVVACPGGTALLRARWDAGTNVKLTLVVCALQDGNDCARQNAQCTVEVEKSEDAEVPKVRATQYGVYL